MASEVKIPRSLQDFLVLASTATSSQLVQLAQNSLIRKTVVREVEKMMMSELIQSRSNPEIKPGIMDDRTSLGLAIVDSLNRALAEKRLSDNSIQALLNILVKVLLIEKGDQTTAAKFEARFGERPPSFMVLSPGKACNLHCTGCYADAGEKASTLEWSIVDRMIDEARTLWGSRFVVISGGEPFAYRSEGKGLLDLIEKHPDCYFMAYTNGTLINEEVSRRIAQDGNLLPCISVEGWRERTDERRGAGVFDKVLETMRLLRKSGVPFGISLTATRHNAEEILSDEFIDFFMDQGAIFAWLFQYMPIGRAFTLDLMVTPQQRAWMWHRSWDIIRDRRFFIADFWNHGTVCDGCLSAGGHGNGGYFYVDWNGTVSPCVFMPYSPVNIKDVFARGGNLNDIWQEKFFTALRGWQHSYKAQNRNGLAPCPNRDHHDELEQLLREYEPEPTDFNAAETLTDPEYTSGLKAYNHEFEALTDEIWLRHYVNGEDVSKNSLTPLPEVPGIDMAEVKTDEPEPVAVK